MSEPKLPKSAAEQLAEAEKKAALQTLWLAKLRSEQAAVEKLGPKLIEALKAFEGSMRAQNIEPEEALVLASAVQASVKRRLLWKCGAQKEDTPEEMARIAELHNAVHDLAVLGGRLENRLVKDSAVVGVGKMTMDDIAKGS